MEIPFFLPIFAVENQDSKVMGRIINYKVGDKVEFFVTCYEFYTYVDEEFSGVKVMSGTITFIDEKVGVCKIDTGDQVYSVSMTNIVPTFIIPNGDVDNNYTEAFIDLKEAILPYLCADEVPEAALEKIEHIFNNCKPNKLESHEDKCKRPLKSKQEAVAELA